MSAHVWAVSGFLADKVLTALMSAIVALAVLHIGRRRELRKLSIDMYREFYSPDFSASRYEAERFFDQHGGTDWRKTDPFAVGDECGHRKGYASMTRYFARLSILYRERELDRELLEKLLSRSAGYWWGFVYERMTERDDMYTRDDLRFIFRRLGRGRRATDFEDGYRDGVRRRSALAMPEASLDPADQGTP